MIQPASFQLRIRPSPHSVVDDLSHARRRRPRQRAERVAIQVDETAGIRRVERELRAQGRQRVVAIDRQALVSRRLGHAQHLSIEADKLAPHVTSARRTDSGVVDASSMSGEALVRAMGTFGLAAAIVNITIGGGIFRLPASVAGRWARPRRSPTWSVLWPWG